MTKRLHRLERIVDERESAAIQRAVAEVMDQDEAHSREVTRALSSPDPQRRAWAAAEREKIAALAAMSNDDYLVAVFPRMEAACRAAGIV